MDLLELSQYPLKCTKCSKCRLLVISWLYKLENCPHLEQNVHISYFANQQNPSPVNNLFKRNESELPPWEDSYTRNLIFKRISHHESPDAPVS